MEGQIDEVPEGSPRIVGFHGSEDEFYSPQNNDREESHSTAKDQRVSVRFYVERQAAKQLPCARCFGFKGKLSRQRAGTGFRRSPLEILFEDDAAGDAFLALLRLFRAAFWARHVRSSNQTFSGGINWCSMSTIISPRRQLDFPYSAVQFWCYKV